MIRMYTTCIRHVHTAIHLFFSFFFFKRLLQTKMFRRSKEIKLPRIPPVCLSERCILSTLNSQIPLTFLLSIATAERREIFLSLTSHFYSILCCLFLIFVLHQALPSRCLLAAVTESWWVQRSVCTKKGRDTPDIMGLVPLILPKKRV